MASKKAKKISLPTEELATLIWKIVSRDDLSKSNERIQNELRKFYTFSKDKYVAARNSLIKQGKVVATKTGLAVVKKNTKPVSSSKPTSKPPKKPTSKPIDTFKSKEVKALEEVIENAYAQLKKAKTPTEFTKALNNYRSLIYLLAFREYDELRKNSSKKVTCEKGCTTSECHYLSVSQNDLNLHETLAYELLWDVDLVDCNDGYYRVNL